MALSRVLTSSPYPGGIRGNLPRRDHGRFDPEELDPEELDPEELDPEQLDPEQLDPEQLGQSTVVHRGRCVGGERA
jgi:hypothetical protein